MSRYIGFWGQRNGAQSGMVVQVAMILALLFSACKPITAPAAATSQPSEESALTPISIGVGYIPSVQFASYYVAIEKGFFAEEGIEASLEYGFENDYLKLVGL